MSGTIIGAAAVNTLWRNGRHLGRTIYAIADPDGSRDDDPLIGIMDDAAVARAVVEDHNERREGVR